MPSVGMTRHASKPAGSPRICRSQSVATSSNSVAAGEACQTIALTLTAAVSISARTPGADPVIANQPKKAGWFQWVSPGTIRSRKSAKAAESGSLSSGGVAGSERRTSPGRTSGTTAYLAAPSR